MAMTEANALPDDVDALKAIIAVMADRNARLERLVEAFKQAMFGRKSEKLDPDQFELALEDIETGISLIEAEKEASPAGPSTGRKPPRATNRGSLPKHLPRIEVVIEPETTVCSCGSDLHVIGEDVSERLDVIPAQFRVIATRRPRYGCRACDTGVVQALAPARLIPAGLPTEAMIAHVLVAKYADHLPLYRQAQIYARQGVDLDRSTLAHWVGRAAFELKPVFDCLTADLKRSSKLFMDETRAPVLDPGRRRTKTGYFWSLARDDRPWAGPDPPGVAYCYAPGRGGAHAETFLKGFSGILQIDGYAGYNRLTRDARADGPIRLAYCWAHARRKLHEIAKGGPAPIAEDGLRRIAELYRIEQGIRGLAPDERLRVRQAKSAPLVDAFGEWITHTRARVSAKSALGEALRYIVKLWDGLNIFLEDGRVEIDSNAVERAIRPIALNRKNALFAGHDAGAENWGVIASLIETAKLNSVEPHAYLTRTLEAIVNGHKQRDIHQLLPWYYAS
jgi:transposase